MQCQSCNKPATVHLTEIVNGEKIERHLCEECARNEGITIKAQIPLGELLNSLNTAQKEVQRYRDMVCPDCGISWLKFRKEGLLGCPKDYEVFAEPLSPLIQQAQNGAIRHKGKTPQQKGQWGMDHHNRLIRLRQDLQQAVETEDYERAAKLRDELRHIS